MGKRDKKADSANGSRSHGWTPKGGKGGSGLTPEQTAAFLTFVTPTATVGEGVSKETQAILDKLGEKIKEAAKVRDLTKGNGKIADKQHRAIEKLAKECADAHFTSPDSLKALKSLVKSGGVQTQAGYSHTLLQAIFKCCTQRGIQLSREEIGLSEPEEA